MNLEIIKQEYDLILKSGMFWEWHPTLSGNWQEDKNEFIEFYKKYKWNLNKIRKS